jgi:hypothetical protein
VLPYGNLDEFNDIDTVQYLVDAVAYHVCPVCDYGWSNDVFSGINVYSLTFPCSREKWHFLYDTSRTAKAKIKPVTTLIMICKDLE